MPPENPRTIWSARSRQFEALEQRRRALRALARIDAKICAMEEQYFASRKREIKIRALLHHADQPLDRDLLLPHIVLANPRLAAGWPHARRENSDRRRFARAVWSEQAENFPGQDFERNAVQRNDLRLGLLVSLAARRGKAEAPAGRERRRRSVDLA